MLSQSFQFSSLAGSSFTTSDATSQSSDAETSDVRDYTRSDSWRQLVAQVESSLCREDRSCQALDQLQQLAAEHGASTQFLLKSVIRETIRLTMECLSEAKTRLSFTSLGRVEGRVEERTLPIEKAVPVLTAQEKQIQDDAAMVEALNHALKSADAPSLLDRLRSPGHKAVPKLSPEALHQQAIEARTRDLHALCDHVHTVRLSLGLELKQIHAETFIGLHHLQALDQGKIDRLPEDVYLRGFLRRLEKCLHRPEGDLTSRLPNAIPQTNLGRTGRSPLYSPLNSSLNSSSNLPSSHTQSNHTQSLNTQFTQPSSPGLNLPFQPNYAYLTYAALMASGVFLISHQGSPKSTLTPLKIDAQPPAPATIGKPQKMSSESVQKAQMRVSQNVSTPEVFA